MSPALFNQLLSEANAIEHVSQRLEAAVAALDAATGPDAPASVRAALSPLVGRIRTAVAPTTQRLVELNQAVQARAAQHLPPATLTPSPSSN